MPDDDEHDVEDVLTGDAAWWVGSHLRVEDLASNAYGQQERWPVDDVVQPTTHVTCPRRGTHPKTTRWWLCFDDWVSGRADLTELLVTERPARPATVVTKAAGR